MNKTIVPPTGDKHTYMSWVPYWWPDCSNVGNITVLPESEGLSVPFIRSVSQILRLLTVYTKCKYVRRDGELNPDVRLVSDTGEFQAMSDATLYNTLAWIINGSDAYMKNAVHYIDTWFINPDTYMYPNLDFAQGRRGVGGNNGSQTGVL